MPFLRDRLAYGRDDLGPQRAGGPVSGGRVRGSAPQRHGGGIVRDESLVFGGTNRSCPPTRWRICTTWSVPAVLYRSARVVQGVCMLCFRAAAGYRTPSRQAAFAVG